jgi:MFS transporter, NNP family, nitrate/nitrite transporter
MSDSHPPPSARAHLVFATIAIALCFAAWGLAGASLAAVQQTRAAPGTGGAWLVGMPVMAVALLAALLGWSADRFGLRAVFVCLMLATAGSVLAVWRSPGDAAVVGVSALAGLAAASVAAGVALVSRWFPVGRQGSALGLFGVGTFAGTAALLWGPSAASVWGWGTTVAAVDAAVLVWAGTWALVAREAPVRPARTRWAVLTRERLSWALAAFAFLTAGGVVAFSLFLPALLASQFALTPADAAWRTAGFVALAVAGWASGGWLSDRIDGARVLGGALAGLVPFALLLAWPALVPFTVGALGCALLLGFGTGAVFKLVPQYFPADAGAVAGLVVAAGGLGGFLPAVLIGLSRQTVGVRWPAYVLLAATALVLRRLNRVTLVARRAALEPALPADLRRTADRLRAGSWATLGTAVLVALIVVGSRNLRTFDPALVIYTFAVIFATWGVLYHYRVWLDKPPTRVYWRRGWELFRAQGLAAGVTRLTGLVGRQIAAQVFIRRRSTLRWVAHQCLFWGCVLAVAITFPLVFGWIAFRTPLDQMTYVAYLFGFPALTFRLGTPLAELLFHGLDVSAMLVLAGVALALWRRLRDKGAQAIQSFAFDFFPLVLLFAISVTGLALTASQLWLEGEFYSFLAILHAMTVILALLYLPFGKFFHIFQRPAQLGVKLYQRAGDAGPGAVCPRCGERFASRMHVDDLARVLPELGFDYRVAGPARTWQALCPACKRKALSVAQLRLKGAAADRP